MKRKLQKLSLFKEIDEFNQRDSDGHLSDDSSTSDDFLNSTFEAYESQIFISSNQTPIHSEQLQFIQGVFDKSEESEQSFYFNITNIEGDNRTTLMMRNIPQNYTKEMLIMEIDPKFKNKFDYFNLPFDGTANPGYAFINLKSKSYLKDFYNYFNGRKWKTNPHNKPCYLKYAKIQHKKFKQINPQIYLQQSSVIKLIQSQKLQCSL
ncbi:unnamed protein product (macronuclear) [Paramecium tetraurelia]|uniref:Mei2-like C-terminal RNA recognition motif domain-containing protein n=1 Tax=Paramecium tetraurelia TaxID=5888 RepID=A0C7M5_PARTE|nr:uncharacterized protein GSPATT00035922001 [Paramecium tetraurelia]CAK66792.1 unnamed protein product [Paramecium tetraurelia]|eukprot:XP_001434189.1 hypothetical protein (macronuclear) [Paramecium tetraurelia strain d4-2]